VTTDGACFDVVAAGKGFDGGQQQHRVASTLRNAGHVAVASFVLLLSTPTILWSYGE
jgi:hypothetical protein